MSPMLTVKMFQNVCRLCLSQEHLVRVFDEKIADDNMAEIVKVTCGVEISKNDTVTQMVCSTCCQITIKMYQFRTKSIKNDKDLKARYAGFNISQLTNTASSTPPAAESDAASCVSSSSCATVVSRSVVSPSRPLNLTYKFAHPSIREVVKKHPTIKLPNSCLKSHVGAYITLLTDEVDEWYKERNYTDTQIAKLKKEAFEASNPTKRTPSQKRRKVDEKKPIPASPANTVKRMKLSRESEPATKKLKETSDPNASKTANQKNSPLPLLEKSNTFEKLVDNKSVAKGVKTRSSDCEKSNLPLTPTSDSSAKENSLLCALLVNDKEKEAEREVITLKSLLIQSESAPLSNELSVDVNDIIEIDDTPSPQPSEQSIEETQSKNRQSKRKRDPNPKRTVPQEDFALFSSRPFVKDGAELERTATSVCSNSSKNAEKKSSSEPIVIDLDNWSSSSSASGSHENDKTAFAEALELTPRTTESNMPDLSLISTPRTIESNMPDLSLVSLQNKSHTLYTCKVCDSQHSSLKDLKQHTKRMHTKCPFCNKRFRTSTIRDEHVKNTCVINNSPVKLKKVRLELVRVDEDVEIRKIFASAFEDESHEDGTEVTDVTESQAVVDVNTPADSCDAALTAKAPVASKTQETPVECDTATANAINELEKFLNFAEDIQIREAAVAEARTTAGQDLDTTNKTDIIYISDDEMENPPTAEDPKTLPTSVQKMNVVNSEILNYINLNDNDMSVLKKILSQAKKKSEQQEQQNTWCLENSPILDGSNSRVKIFKKLRKYLQQYKVPIHVKYGSKLSVEYKKSQPPSIQKPSDRWYKLARIELTPPHTAVTQAVATSVKHKIVPPKMSTVPTVIISTPTKFNAATSTILTSTPVILNTASSMISSPAKLNTVTSTILSSTPVILNTASTGLSSAPTILNSTLTKLNAAPKRSNAAPAKPNAFKILNGEIYSNSTKPSTTSVLFDSGTRTGSINLQQHQDKASTACTVQDNQVSTANLANTIKPSNVQAKVTTRVQNSGSTPNHLILTSQSHANTVMNGNCNIRTGPNFTKFILVSNSLLQSSLVQSTQSPLPVIQSVTSAVSEENTIEQPSLTTVEQLESITNSLMPTTSCNVVVSVANVVVPAQTTSVQSTGQKGYAVMDNVTQTQPSIRVKNLKELS